MSAAVGSAGVVYSPPSSNGRRITRQYFYASGLGALLFSVCSVIRFVRFVSEAEAKLIAFFLKSHFDLYVFFPSRHDDGAPSAPQAPTK